MEFSITDPLPLFGQNYGKFEPCEPSMTNSSDSGFFDYYNTFMENFEFFTAHFFNYTTNILKYFNMLPLSRIESRKCINQRKMTTVNVF